MIEVVGDDWDTPIYEALRLLPKVAETRNDRYEQTLRVVIEAAGPMLCRFLAVHRSHLRRVAGSDAELLFLDGLANYYVSMGAAIEDGTARNIPGWQIALATLSRDLVNSTGPSIHVCFQLGLPILCPQLISEATSRPVAVVVHRSSMAVQHLLRNSVKPLRLIFVEDNPTANMIRALREGYELFLNVDTAYPGSRALRIPFLAGQISIPVGWCAVARRVACDVRPLALLRAKRTLRCVTRCPVSLDKDDVAASAVVGFFEPLVRRDPLQWLGWGSYEGD